VFRTALTAAVFLMLSNASTMAQLRAASKACAVDVKAQCASVQPGEGRVSACVERHFKHLSLPCKTALVRAGTAIKKACTTDANQFCAGVKPGGDRIGMCLRPHLDDLSQPCKDALAQVAVGMN
jgi:Cysteine rich repeat